MLKKNTSYHLIKLSDVTNTYFYGSKCQLGNPGYSKDGKRKSPLIQIGLAVTQEEGIPVFHKTFKGNIHDSRTLTALVNSFSEYNLRSGLLVYDRGIASSKNLSYRGIGLEYIVRNSYERG